MARAHRRKIVVDGKTYTYAVGRQATWIGGVGVFSHQRIGYCTDTSMDVYRITPRTIELVIRNPGQDRNRLMAML